MFDCFHTHHQRSIITIYHQDTMRASRIVHCCIIVNHSNFGSEETVRTNFGSFWLKVACPELELWIRSAHDGFCIPAPVNWTQLAMSSPSAWTWVIWVLIASRIAVRSFMVDADVSYWTGRIWTILSRSRLPYHSSRLSPLSPHLHHSTSLHRTSHHDGSRWCRPIKRQSNQKDTSYS